MQSIHENIIEKVKNLPTKPGVYMWLDRDGAILYAGKAKNLRARVQSYLSETGDGRPQLPWLMSQAAALDYIATDSEIEALVTEANLVKAKKPKYNVRLKDDKSYPYIKITKEAAPRIFLTRTIRHDGSRYLGPYTDVRAVRRTLELVHSLFPLRYCRDVLPSKRKKRACLNYQIGKCSGPCVGNISLEDYNKYVDDAYRFIIGKNRDLIRDLTTRMKAAAQEQKFEYAADLRDLIRSVRKVNERRKVFSTALITGNWDVVNYHVEGTQACVVVMEIREGSILGKKHYILDNVRDTSPAELLRTFLTQYYLQKTWMPKQIHLPEPPDDADTIETLFRERAGGKFAFHYPQRGEKLRLLNMTAMNAKMILREKADMNVKRKDVVPEIVLALKKDLNLDTLPRTIACIDISHLHGADTVGSLVFFRDGKPLKREYRRFKIENVHGIDDFASMREVVRRYFSRRLEEKKPLPDLLLVDGGKGQLSSAVTVLGELDLDSQAVAGLAKRLEEVFLPGVSDPQNIPKYSPAIHLLQRIRDEAHRFAITYQKNLRTKRVIATALTDIEGIGPAKAAALLKRFGSVEAIRNAPLEDIAAVEGIGVKLGKVIKKNKKILKSENI